MKCKNVCNLDLANALKDEDGILITQDGKARRMTMPEFRAYCVDAGYYVPAVSDDGVVTFTPTEEGMEAVPPFDLLGAYGTPYTNEEIIRRSTLLSMGLPADALPADAFDAVYLMTFPDYGVMFVVRDEEGNPVPLAQIVGAQTADGQTPQTGTKGTAMAVCSATTEVTIKSPYLDLEQVTLTINPDSSSGQIIEVTLPFASEGYIQIVTDSGEYQVLQAREADLCVVGGGTGGTGGQGGGGFNSTSTPWNGAGGAGGAGGAVYNHDTPVQLTPGEIYNTVIGAGGAGGAGTAGSDGRSSSTRPEKGAAGTAGGTTSFNTFSSSSGASDSLPLNDDTLPIGGAGAKGGAGGTRSGNGSNGGYSETAGGGGGGGGGGSGEAFNTAQTGGAGGGSAYGSAGGKGSNTSTGANTGSAGGKGGAGGLAGGGGGGGGGGAGGVASSTYYKGGNGGTGGQGGPGAVLLRFK